MKNTSIRTMKFTAEQLFAHIKPMFAGYRITKKFKEACMKDFQRTYPTLLKWSKK